MITPELMTMVILAYIVLGSVSNIALGAMKREKSTRYGDDHVFAGIIGLLCVMLFLII